MRIDTDTPDSSYAEVYLNGVRLFLVRAVDTDARWVDRLRTDKDGKPIIEGNAFSEERIYLNKESKLEVFDMRTHKPWGEQ